MYPPISTHHSGSAPLTSTQFVVGPVAVEVVALAVLPVVDLGGVLPLLALAGSAHALPVVGADVRPVVLAAVGVQVLGAHLVLTALAHRADTPRVTPAPGDTR